MKGFQKGDPLCVEAARKSHAARRAQRPKRSAEWYQGYAAGWKAGRKGIADRAPLDAGKAS